MSLPFRIALTIGLICAATAAHAQRDVNQRANDGRGKAGSSPRPAPEDRIATTRMKPPVARNPEWESGFRAAFARLRPNEEALRFSLYSPDWYVQRNAITGQPEYRQIGTWVAARRADGTCWIYSLDLYQDWNGNGYDPGRYEFDPVSHERILCENV